MPNNRSRKIARREKLAANKAARNAAGVNMFDSNVHVALFNLSKSPLGGTKVNPSSVMAYHGSTGLRAPDSFTGPFGGQLLHNERKQMQLLGLPVDTPVDLGSQQAALNAIIAENNANTLATKSASSVNTQNDKNIREQMGKLNASSSKSLDNLERNVAISSYRENILRRVQGSPFLYPQVSDPLLSGWYEAKNGSGAPYYYKADGIVQWNRPTLPPGWYEAKNENGIPYYYKSDGTVQWNVPLKGGRLKKQKRKSRNKY